jgi:hypothetical protein
LSVDVSRVNSMTFKARNMRPLSPVEVKATCNTAGGDWILNWTRRTRKGGMWRDLVDADLGEASESYEVDIVLETGSSAGTSVKRTTPVTTSTFTYTTAMQVADFGSTQGTIYYRVYQVNTVVGRSPDPVDYKQAFASVFLGYYSSTYSVPVMNGGPFVAPVTGYIPLALNLHFNGINGSKTIVDSGAYNLTMTANGAAALTNTSPHFGSASANFNGGSDSITSSYNANVIDLPNMFRIGFWFNTTQTGSAYYTFISRPVGGFTAGAWTILFDGSGAARPQIYWADFATTSPFMTSSVAGLNNGVDHYLEWGRTGNTHTMSIDGVIVATATTAANFTPSTSGITIGNDTVFGGRGYAGRIDEVVFDFTQGAHTANFTPPTAEQ